MNSVHGIGRLFLALVVLSSLANMNNLATGAQASEFVRVYMNHARILKFDQDVASVIVGNAEVADVTVSDPKTIILTGKSYGATNLVILDQDGDAIVDKRVIVSVDEENSVRVFKQTDRAVLSCTPTCESSASGN